MCPPTVGKWSDTCVVLSYHIGKQFNHSLKVPYLTNEEYQCISQMIVLNMHELNSNGMCLVPPPNGILTRRK